MRWAIAVATFALTCVARAEDPPAPTDASASRPAAATPAAAASAAAAAAVAAAAAAAAKASLAAGASNPKMVPGSCVRPEYPLASVRAEESGTTRVRVSVSETGVVKQAFVETSSGHPRLDGAAREALSLCRFEPARDTAGFAIPGTTVVEYAWRLSDAAPDPWVAVRAASGKSPWAVTEDLGAVAEKLTTATQTTPEQRIKILRRVQEVAIKNANCGNIEQLRVAPPPADMKFPPVIDPKTTRELRIVRERWSATQCGVSMGYALIMRFPEGEAANFTMVPLGPAIAPRPTGLGSGATYAARVAAAIRSNIVFAAGERNPVAEVELTLAPDGLVTSSHLSKRSGDSAWDQAVLAAIRKTGRMPLDDNGTSPPTMVVSLRPR